MKKFLFVILTTLIVSCTDDFGHHVSGENFSVYFPDVRDKELAEKIAYFWKENDLITGKAQDVQLVRSKRGYYLYLIADEKKKDKSISFEELKALQELQSAIQDSIFINQSVEIVVTDDQFKPVFNINE